MSRPSDSSNAANVEPARAIARWTDTRGHAHTILSDETFDALERWIREHHDDVVHIERLGDPDPDPVPPETTAAPLAAAAAAAAGNDGEVLEGESGDVSSLSTLRPCDVFAWLQESGPASVHVSRSEYLSRRAARGGGSSSALSTNATDDGAADRAHRRARR